ncbi:MAG: hypothetical protein Ta2E_09390 [Mycoplasmoidaceae bacterium]|nr:MAG: hypothetical protein Ta2E_09390 [Mycoplasmoidaceae bacterium]
MESEGDVGRSEDSLLEEEIKSDKPSDSVNCDMIDLRLSSNDPEILNLQKVERMDQIGNLPSVILNFVGT